MADLASLIIKVDSRDVAKTREQLAALGLSATNAEQKVTGSTKRIGSAFGSLGGIIQTALGAAAIRSIINTADAAQQLQGRLKLVTDGAADLKRVNDALFASSQRTGTAFASNADLYIKLATVGGELGKSQAQLLKFTEGIGNALTLSGASAQSASGALLQLSQAIGGGIVRAEEFNSILEGAPVIIQTVAKNLDAAGGSVASLRRLVNDGKVSSVEFFDAFERGSGGLAASVSQLPRTVARAATEFENEFKRILQSSDLTPVVEGIDELKKTLSDPAVIRGLTTLISSLVEAAGAAARAAAELGSLGNLLADKFANLTGVSTALDRVNQDIGDVDKALTSSAFFKPAKFLFTSPEKLQAIRTELVAQKNELESVDRIVMGLTRSTAAMTDVNKDAEPAVVKLADAHEKQKKAVKSATQEVIEQIAVLVRVQALMATGLDETEAQTRAELESRGVKAQVIEQLIAEKNAIEAVNQAREDFIDQLQEALKAEEDGRNEATRAAERQAAEAEKYQEQMSRAAEQAAEVMQRAYERSAGKIEDVFERLFRSSLDGFKSFKRALMDSFKDLLTQLALQAAKNRILIPITTAILGSAPIGAQASDGGAGGGLGDLLGGLKSLFNPSTFASFGDKFFNSGVLPLADALGAAGFEDLAVSLTNFGASAAPIIGQAAAILGPAAAAFGVGKTVGGLFENKGVFGGNTGNYVGAGAATGAAIGSVVPVIGTAIGAVVGAAVGFLAAGIIGNWKTKSQTIGIALTDGLLNATLTQVDKKKSLLGSKTRTSVDQVAGIDAYLGPIFESIVKGSQELGLSLAGFDNAISVSVLGLDQAAATIAINNAVATAALPTIAEYQQANEDLLQTYFRVVGQTIAVRDALEALGGVAQIASGVLGIEMVQALADAAGGFDALQSSLSYFYENFYSEAERTSALTANLTTAFGALGVALPESAEAFRTLVNSIDTSTASGQTLYTSLLRIAPAFSQISSAAQQAASQMAQAAAQLAAQSQQLDIRLATASGNEPLALSLTRQAELAATDPSLQGKLQAIYVAEDAAKAAADAAAKQQAAAAKQQAAASKQLEAAKKNKDIAANLRDYVRGLGQDANIVGESAAFTAAQDNLTRLVGLARNKDAEAAGQLTGAAGDFLTLKAGLATSREDLRRAQGLVSSMLLGVANVFDPNAEQKASLKNIDRQTREAKAVHEEHLKVARETLDAIREPRVKAAANDPIIAPIIEAAARERDTRDRVDGEEKVRRFARGGDFGGGLRIVGENGPEIEATGPSRIFNANQTRSMMAGDGSAEDMKAMRAEMKQAMYQVAKNTGEVAKFLRSWDDGDRMNVNILQNTGEFVTTKVAA